MAIFCSLVALVKAEYSFDNTLQDRAARFLKSLEPKWSEVELARQLVTDLVPSSVGSPSGFVESILTLLSSPHSTIVTAALSFVYETSYASRQIRSHLVETDLIPNVFATVQPHKLPIAGNETVISLLMKFTEIFVLLADSSSLRILGVDATVDRYNRREMIFQKVVLPSSHHFHRPTLEFVLASPIVMAFSSCLSIVEDDMFLWTLLGFNDSLDIWATEGPEVSQSAKRMMQALISEGFEDTLELMVIRNENGYYGEELVDECRSISELLGLNVEFTEE
ncbi:hypothetical protein BLNAU_21625 [Blattamonas nauphoetae]|uniref:Uncharacterized protein n=1 Tax=Blattamonas nauphoetae TaxID=2049346 RepID=A0ABQ9WVB4_9EUKA|nr:hypothetical protein BLNAU_21625 [Blattamonas nauphoetae]